MMVPFAAELAHCVRPDRTLMLFDHQLRKHAAPPHQGVALLHHLMNKWWDGTAWSDWDWVGGQFHDHPAAVSWGRKTSRCFVRGKDSHLL
jgi:hypothetical protein